MADRHPTPAPRRPAAAPAGNVSTDAISFSTVRREAIRSMNQSQVTATTRTTAQAKTTGRATGTSVPTK